MEYGLIGEKISYSISPQIHQMIFQTLGLSAQYRLMPIARQKLSEADAVLRRMDGVNITIPYKQALMPLCDEIAPEARRIGAINTIYNKAGKLYGYNTDYYGFGKMVDCVGYTAACPPRVCAVLGSGGASLAVTRYLQDIGAEKVYIVSRTPGKNTIGYDRLRQLHGDILINATPVGTFPDVQACPVSETVIGRFGAALDLIYNPNPTKFLQIARQQGLKTCSGLIMLVGQAVKSEEIWQECTIPDTVTRVVYAQMKTLLENGE